MRIILALSFIFVNLLIALWDVYCAAKGDYLYTVSATFQEWAQDYPMLPLAIGVVIGHVFWPTRPH